jgi:thioredoxin 1
MRKLMAVAVLMLGGIGLGYAQSAPIVKQQIYPAVDASPANIQAAIALAHRTHRRVIVDFGGDWCGDCQVLNIYFHQSPNAELLEKYFVLVDVNIGHIDQNIDIGNKYGVALKKGVPALAVLDGEGRVVFAQKNGEFENMRHLQSSDLTEFLNKWKR